MLGHKVIFGIFSTFKEETIKTISKYRVKLLHHQVLAGSCNLNPLGHPEHAGKDVGVPSYLDEM